MALIQMQCGGCGALMQVAQEHEGKQARCPKCKSVQMVPSANLEDRDGKTSALERLWVVRASDGQEYGPVPRAELDQWMHQGRVVAETQIREDQSSHWVQASEVYPNLRQPEPLATERRQVSTAYSSPTQPAASHQPTTYTGPNDRFRRFQQPHRGVLILVLGIAGLAISCPMLSLIAWTMGSGDLRRMRSGQMDPAGMDTTRVGMILGMIYSILFLAVLALVLLMLMFTAIA